MPEEKKSTEKIDDEDLEAVTGGALKSGRPFFCGKCGKEFRSAASRDAHQKTCKGSKCSPEALSDENLADVTGGFLTDIISGGWTKKKEETQQNLCASCLLAAKGTCRAEKNKFACKFYKKAPTTSLT